MAEEAATAASLQLTASKAVADAKVSQLQSQSTLLEQMGRQQEAAEVQSTKLEGEAAELTRSLAETRAMLVRGIPLLVLLQRALGLSASLCLSIRDGRLLCGHRWPRRRTWPWSAVSQTLPCAFTRIQTHPSGFSHYT
jgi:hypothetical protein